MLWLFWFARSWNSSARCATRITSSTCGYLVRPQCHTLTEELTESKTIEDELLESTFRCHTMWRRPAWLVWKLKTWKDMKTSLDAPSKQEFANSKVSWRNCSFTFHHIWDVLWRKFRYRYILYPEELFRYDMPICVRILVCQTVFFDISFSGQAGTEQLCQLARLLARRRLRERNYVSWLFIETSVKARQKQRTIVPLCAIDMQQASNQSVKHLSTCWGRHGGCAFAP